MVAKILQDITQYLESVNNQLEKLLPKSDFVKQHENLNDLKQAESDLLNMIRALKENDTVNDLYICEQLIYIGLILLKVTWCIQETEELLHKASGYY